MSADNWGVCPKCKFEHEKLADIIANDYYGKIPAGEYAQKMKEASKKFDYERNLREDYEIYTDEDGLFYVSYGCECYTCKFSFYFEHKIQLELDETQQN